MDSRSRKKHISDNNMIRTPEKKPRKIRRKSARSQESDDLMKSIICDIEEEIEKQLDMQAERNNMTAANVKRILKAVIRDNDVKQMVRQTLYPSENDVCLYEQKLTRSKIRELVSKEMMPHWPVTPVKKADIVSECLTLMQQELPEEPSDDDEEYRPEYELNQTPYSVNSDTESEPATPLSCSRLNASEISYEDTIYKRTRSKFPLTDTSLETLEQAFVPPDITPDMYSCDFERDDTTSIYFDFLKAVADPSSEVLPDEPADDPEYNILADVDETVDYEEFRMDRAVKISQRELNDLLKETHDNADAGEMLDAWFTDPENFATTEALLLDEKNTTTEIGTECEQTDYLLCVSTPKSQQDIDNEPAMNIDETEALLLDDKNTTTEIRTESEQTDYLLCVSTPKSQQDIDNEPAMNIDEKELLVPEEQSMISAAPIEVLSPARIELSPEQRALLKQQMQQHIQLSAQSFVQCKLCAELYRDHSMLEYANAYKSFLIMLKAMSGLNKDSTFYGLNLVPALELVQLWETQYAKEISQDKKRITKKLDFSDDLLKVFTKSSAFLYPGLLPERLFMRCMDVTKLSQIMTPSEDRLLAIGLEEFIDFLKKRGKLSNLTKHVMNEAIKLIIDYLLPLRSVRFLVKYIQKKKKEPGSDVGNPIKYYCVHGKAPPTPQYVVDMTEENIKPLHLQPLPLMPERWSSYIADNYILIAIVR